jgi:hypothetical protein
VIPLGILAAAGGAVAVDSYDLLATEILTASQSSITFGSLGTYAADYQHLQIRMVARVAGTGGARSSLLQFNADSGNNYNGHFLIGNGSSVSSFSSGLTNKIFLGISGNLSETNQFGASVVDILDPFVTLKNTTVRTLGGKSSNEIGLISGFYINTAAITEIKLLPEASPFQIGSRFSLYGLKAGA